MRYVLGRCLLAERLNAINSSQQALAEKEGYSAQQISDYATGKRKMSLVNAITIAETLGCSVKDLYECVPVKRSVRRRQSTKKPV